MPMRMSTENKYEQVEVGAHLANSSALSECFWPRKLKVSRPCMRRKAPKGFSVGPMSRNSLMRNFIANVVFPNVSLKISPW